jgi:transposase
MQRLADGYSTEEVSDFLGVDPRSVRRWRAASGDGGDDGLARRPAPGRSPSLSTTQEKIVRRWLSDLPSEYGFATDLWSAPRLARLIEQEFGVHFHPNYLSVWLRRRGYTPQKPRRVPRERDDQAIACWLAQDWPRIKQKARRRGAGLLFLDESGLLMAPLLRRSWALRGNPPESKYKAGHRQKVSVAGTLWLSPYRDQLHLGYQTLVNGYFTNTDVAAFLDGIVRGSTNPVIALWDCGSMHKGPPIRTLVEESGKRLAIEPLPAHAASLMPVEFLWRWLKYGRLCNFTPRDAEDLNAAVVRELDAIWDNQVLLASFFHQSDLSMPRTLLT